MRRQTKKWTVMLYLCGNNELEPEVYFRVKELLLMYCPQNIYLVIETGLENREFSRILRYKDTLPDTEEDMTGVRRITRESGKEDHIEELGRVNMADPMSLYSFLRWALLNYPSERNLLIIGGHGAAIAGGITDFSGDKPYIMGIPEMCKAINTASDSVDKKIDLLFLDMCYMNFVEIMYELCWANNCKLEYAITYVDEGPFKGLPYHEIIMQLENEPDLKTIDIINMILDKNIYNLMSVHLDYSRLKRLKKLSGNIAYSYMTNCDTSRIDPDEVFQCCTKDLAWYKAVAEFKKTVKNITVFHAADSLEEAPLRILTLNLGDSMFLYNRLGFARNNCWTNLLCGTNVNKSNSSYTNIPLKPTVLSTAGMIGLIASSNPLIDINTASMILKRIKEYKKWR